MVVGFRHSDLIGRPGGGTPHPAFNDPLQRNCHQPHRAEDWWIYSLLLSTMIPSLVNLTIVDFRSRGAIKSFAVSLRPHAGGETSAPPNNDWLALC